jgi:hypothetical protein
MSDPTIPLLGLKTDHSVMGIKNNDTYGLHFEIEAAEDWLYTPSGRFPDYEPQIVISIRIGLDSKALCASTSAADNIFFTQLDRESTSSGTSDAQSYNWHVTIQALVGDVIISKESSLVIQMNKIEPNDVEGEATICLLPRLKSLTGKADINGTVMSYKVQKTTPPIVISDVRWSLLDNPGLGTLTWTVTGDAKHCTIQANEEDIGKAEYCGEHTQYKADELILQAGPQIVTITAWDQDDNTATYTTTINLKSFNPYFNLQVKNGRSLSLVQNDQTTQLYAVFSPDGSSAELWENDQSGTQDNWKDTCAKLISGYETSPCVYYNSQFYLLGGSSFDFKDFQNNFWKYQDGKWQAIAQPSGWNEPRIGQAVVLFNQSIWIAGGYGASGKVYDDVYSFNQDKDEWIVQPTLPLPLCNTSLAVADGRLYLFGGFSDMPGGNASTKLYCLSGEHWVDQNKNPPGALADYWALGSFGAELFLLGSFDGKAFTGKLQRDLPNWQSTTSSLSELLNFASRDRSPFGFSTFAYRKRLFLIMTATEGQSVFGYYDPGTPS